MAHGQAGFVPSARYVVEPIATESMPVMTISLSLITPWLSRVYSASILLTLAIDRKMFDEMGDAIDAGTWVAP